MHSQEELGHVLGHLALLMMLQKEKAGLPIICSEELNPAVLKLTGSPKGSPLTKLPLQAGIRCKLKQ